MNWSSKDDFQAIPSIKREEPMIIVSIVLAVIGLIAALGLRRAFPNATNYNGDPAVWPKYTFGWGGLGLIAVAIALVFPSVSYTQDRGEVVIQQDWTGNIITSTTETGWHWKSPFVNTTSFDILNQQVIFTDSEEEKTGGTVTVVDAEGVSDQVDIQVQYSLDPSKAIDIFTTYRDEDTLRTQRVFNDVRSVVRVSAGTFDTLDLLTQHDALSADITERLQDKWNEVGLIVNNVSVRGTRAPQSVQDSYAAAQQAQIGVQTAEANLQAQQITAQQLVQSAQAQADANDLLNAHPLSEGTLIQRYLETLEAVGKDGNLILLPNDFTGIINLNKQAQSVTK